MLAAPLNSLMAGKTHGPINLSAEESHAFQKLKDALAEAALLAHPIPNAPLSIMVDASTTAAVISKGRCVPNPIPTVGSRTFL